MVKFIWPSGSRVRVYGAGLRAVGFRGFGFRVYVPGCGLNTGLKRHKIGYLGLFARAVRAFLFGRARFGAISGVLRRIL